jgi:DNA modification methylase
MIQIENKCALVWLKEQSDFSADLIYCDPPYALGSEIIIKPDGKPDYKKAVDFMAKWEMPDGAFWEEFYKEANRVLKHGGHLLMFGIDRQLFLFGYYANLAGFETKQSLYWYTISGFPKASDLEKNILKYLENELQKKGISEIIWED